MVVGYTGKVGVCGEGRGSFFFSIKGREVSLEEQEPVVEPTKGKRFRGASCAAFPVVLGHLRLLGGWWWWWRVGVCGVRGQAQVTRADLTGASSCAVPSDPSGRSTGRSAGT